MCTYAWLLFLSFIFENRNRKLIVSEISETLENEYKTDGLV